MGGGAKGRTGHVEGRSSAKTAPSQRDKDTPTPASPPGPWPRWGGTWWDAGVSGGQPDGGALGTGAGPAGCGPWGC